MDAVQQANSGHPGTPMALAPVAYTLWQEFLRFDPDDPIWPNRDRFVLSNGHASMLLYATAASHRREGRRCQVRASRRARGHARRHQAVSPARQQMSRPSRISPDVGRRDDHRPAGPGLRQQRRHGASPGAGWRSISIGPDFTIFDYDVYVVCGDGDMMEGVSSEAASFAGHQMLGNLCWIYDSNRVTIEGHTDLAFSDDVAARFLAYGWNVQRVGDANDTERLAQAIESLPSEPTTRRP